MTPAEVAARFVLYMDEPDQTFINDALIETFLDGAYQQFRDLVTNINPYIFTSAQPVTFNGRTFDLDPFFLGPLSAARMLRLLAIVQDTPNIVKMNIVQDPEALRVTPLGVLWTADTLTFAADVTGDWQILYLAEADITWTGAPTAFLDDLTPFHDVIALLAYAQYAIMDSATNEQILRHLQMRLVNLEEYVRERSSAGPFYVNHVPQ